MPIDAARSGVASALASYFSSNYEALLQSSAAQQPVTPLAPQAWKDAINATTGVSNANTRFFLKQDGTLAKVSLTATQAQGWTPPANSVEVDLNVAYAIENTGLSPLDWLAKRLADEFRLSAYSAVVSPLHSQTPQPEVNVDFSSLDTASLVRLLNMLMGRSKDAQRDAKIGNAKDMAANAQRLGLSVANLRNALEFQSVFSNQSAVSGGAASLLSGQPSAARDSLVQSAVDRLVAGKASDLAGARLAFDNSAASKVPENKLRRVVQMTTAAVTGALQASGDIALMRSPLTRQFGSVLDYLQTHDGLVIRTPKAQSHAQQVADVKAQLRAALSDPAFRQNLIDAMMAQAHELGVDDLDLADQLALFGEVADAIIDSMLQDDAFLTEVAEQSVQFRTAISQLIGNEVEASHERDSVYRNV